jgi:hypothetical protein
MLGLISISPHIINCGVQHKSTDIGSQRLLFPITHSQPYHIVPIIWKMTKFSKQRTKPELEKHLANHIIQQATVSMEDLVTTNAPKPITKLSINKHKNPWIPGSIQNNKTHPVLQNEKPGN